LNQLFFLGLSVFGSSPGVLSAAVEQKGRIFKKDRKAPTSYLHQMYYKPYMLGYLKDALVTNISINSRWYLVSKTSGSFLREQTPV
jgi:hypothetical protein